MRLWRGYSMGRMIQTVTGPIKPEQLGRTFMHEHLCFGFPGFEYDFSTGKHVLRDEAIAKCVTEAKRLVGQGYQTVVDATPADCGRYPQWLAEISDKSGLQIICVTGYYVEGFSASGYWDLRMHCGGATGAAEEYAELLEAELTNGIGDTGIKAGLIKIATGHHAISAYQQMMIKGAALAHKRTGSVIYTHTEDGELGFDQAKLFLWHECDPTRIVIGHMCGEIRTNRHKDIMDWGFNIGFDRLGVYDTYHPRDQVKASCLSRLIKEGYGDRIVLSQDVICQRLGRPITWPADEVADWRNYQFGYVHDVILPLLRSEYGVKDEEIERLLIDNPRRILG